MVIMNVSDSDCVILKKSENSGLSSTGHYLSSMEPMKNFTLFCLLHVYKMCSVSVILCISELIGTVVVRHDSKNCQSVMT